jgi:glycosyltransferase involved in cell wall biosynthesis
MTTSSPLVSIVIPVFNQADYLARAIDSVLSQECPFRIELIVIDDGSTDHARDILSTYGNSIYWESRQNCGQSATLNYGWKKSSAAILGYLSADDMLKPSAIRQLVVALSENPQAIVAYCDFETIDENGKLIRIVRTSDVRLSTMLSRFECPPGPGALFRRSGFDLTGGWDETFHRMPDYDYWLRMALHGEFVRVPESLSMWRVHEGSQAFSIISVERAEEPIRIFEKFFSKKDLPSELENLRSNSLSVAYLASAQLHARSNRFSLAFKWFNLAVRKKPRLFFALRTWHIVANALFQQPVHRMLGKLRGLFVK